MARQIKPIRPKRISDQVFEQLHDLIMRSEFKPGEKIMTERELAQAFNVSRTSVRDAINKLVVMGMLEQRQGQGTFVRQPGAETHAFITRIMASQKAGLQDLLEVRVGIECHAAALAALRATPEDIVKLETCLALIEAQARDGRLRPHADARFHMAMAEATHNPLQIYLMKQFQDFLVYGIQENLITLNKAAIDLETVVRQHARILAAIRQQDVEGAYQATKAHIEAMIHTLDDIAPAGKRMNA